MKNRLLFLPLIGCALLASCSEEGTNDANNTIELPKQAHGKTITFKAEPLSVETKSLSTKVELEQVGDSEVLKWTDGEDVSFFFAAGSSNLHYDNFTISVDWLSGDVGITGNRPDQPGSYGIYAISPIGAYYEDQSIYSELAIPRIQTQEGSSLSHLSPSLFLFAHPDETLDLDADLNSTGDISLSFDVVGSLLRFDIVNKSSIAVDLQSIKIWHSSSSQLYGKASIHELTGALSNFSSPYDDMTLNFSNASINAGTETSPQTFKAYMAVFPTQSDPTLNIDLSLSTSLGSKTISYQLSSAAFVEKARTSIELDFLDKDLLNDDGSLDILIGKNIYRTYEFPSGSNNSSQIWMIQNSLEGSPSWDSVGYGAFYDIDSKFTACPEPWRLPSRADLAGLIRINNIPVLDIWLSDNAPSQVVLGNRVFTDQSGYFRGWWSLLNDVDAIVVAANTPFGDYFLSHEAAYDPEGDVGYFVRCVRDKP